MSKHIFHIHNSSICVLVSIGITTPKPGPQSRALCGAVCALSIAIVLY